MRPAPPASSDALTPGEAGAIAASLVADLEARLPDVSFMLLPTLALPLR
jgi:hypothetical protein